MAEKNALNMTCCYLIPMYNEVDNLSLLHSNLMGLSVCKNNFYLFVDDCSTDGSPVLVKSLFKDNDFHIIEKRKNAGPGDSFNLGFNYLLEKYAANENVKVITMEADNTSDINILNDMLTISNLGYSLVLASIYAQGGGFSQTSFFRKMLSFTANMIFRTLFDVKTLTLSSFYRVYNLNLLRSIKKNNKNIIEQSGFICMFELLLKSIDEGAKIIEVPMELKSEMRKGKSKMKVFQNAISYLQFLIDYKFKK